MTQILRGITLDRTPVDVPAPPAWDSVALAAYEQGYMEGIEAGRRDLGTLERQLQEAVTRCIADQHASRDQITKRVTEVAELLLTTALRHRPDARMCGLLTRVGEVLRSFEAGPLELTVAPDAVGVVARAVESRNGGPEVTVTGDRTLGAGDFRLHSAWADADGTFQRYLAAARDAVEVELAGGAS